MTKRTFIALVSLLALTGCTLTTPAPMNSVTMVPMTPETIHVLLEATTTGSQKASVTYGVNMGTPSMATAKFRNHWSYEFDLPKADAFDALTRTMVEVTALTDNSSVIVTCSITIDGRLGDHRRQTGKRAYTNCMGAED